MTTVRPIFILIRNVVVAFLAVCQAVIRKIVRAKPVEWVAYEFHGPVDRGSVDDHVSYAWKLPRRARVSTYFQLQRELNALKAAPGVRGVVFRLRDLHCGGALLRDLRALLRDFRAAGKEVVFHADSLDNRQYWLASVASRVWLMPRGRLDLVGFAASSSAAARPFRKFGLVFDVIRAGVFKSAGELFGSDRVSPEQRQQLDELIGDLNDLYLRDISESRGLAREAFQVLIDAGPYHAQQAKAAGLVDDCLYGDEIRAKLGADATEGPRRARVGSFAAMLATHAPAADWRPLRDRRHRVAVVDIEGMIAPGKSRTVPGMAATAGSETLVRALTRLRFEEGVKAVVLRIDSRGGSALASDLIWRAAKRLGEIKPVVAYLDGVAASGGYYIAAAAKQIWAAPTCITGSIGVFMLRPNAAGVFEKIEVDRITVQRGAHASIYQPDHALTDEERALLQRDVLQTYDEFVQTVAEGRHLTNTRVRELAEGRVYLATRGQQVGLVDKLGTLEEAMHAARDLAGLKGDVRVQRIRSRQADWRDLLQVLRRGEAEDLWRAVLPRFDGVQAFWLGEDPL